MKMKEYKLLLVLVLSGLLFSCGNAKEEQKPMNVLFIAFDDLRLELGCYGNTVIKSPNIDALASSGMVFNRAYCQQAICMASRACIMSGMMTETNLIFNCGPVNEAYPNQDKLDGIFKKNGYDVRAFGKIYHHKSDAEEQFGTNWIWKNPKGKEKGRGYLDPASINGIVDDSGRGPAYESPDVEDNEYFDGFQAEEAVKTIDEFSKTGKPFFLAVGFHKPHLPFNAPKKYWDLYSEDDLKLASNQFLPGNYTKNTIYNFGELRNYPGIPKGKDLLPEPLQKKLKHGYYACVSYVDAQLGKVMQKLKNTGLDKNTIVVLWGDHGWKLGEHGMWCKHTNFELDTHVPLIIKVPEMKPGVTQSFAELMDLYPTLAELCHLEKPASLQGKSLVPALLDPTTDGRTEAYSLYPHDQGSDSLVIGYAVVNDRYRYINWIKIRDGKSEGDELYDHSVDPDENVNVAGDEKNKAIVEEMNMKLHQRFKMDSSILEIKN